MKAKKRKRCVARTLLDRHERAVRRAEVARLRERYGFRAWADAPDEAFAAYLAFLRGLTVGRRAAG